MQVLKLLYMLLTALPVKMLGWKFNGRDVNIGYQLSRVFYLCVLAIISIVAAYLFPSYFPGRSESDAFMRSGAITAFISLWATYRLDHIVMPYHDLYADALDFDYLTISNDLKFVVKRLYNLCFFSAVAGVLVWGYGDLFYEYVS